MLFIIVIVSGSGGVGLYVVFWFDLNFSGIMIVVGVVGVGGVVG